MNLFFRFGFVLFLDFKTKTYVYRCRVEYFRRFLLSTQIHVLPFATLFFLLLLLLLLVLLCTIHDASERSVVPFSFRMHQLIHFGQMFTYYFTLSLFLCV